MILIDAAFSTRERYVRNIVKVWESASEGQASHGRTWYQSAHDIAEFIGGGDVQKGAGVLSALSVQTPWEQNVELAHDACETGDPTGHLKDALSKAAKILAGIDPVEVLPMRRKTGNFYRCILDPSDPEAIVIDRHAHDVAVGQAYGDRKRGLDAHGRYALLAHCYREAALRLRELPSTVQAVTWVVWRDREDV